MKNYLVVSCLILICSGCSKEEVLAETPSLIGRWTHYSASDAWETIFIDEDGTGKVWYYTNSKLKEETKTKTWYTQDNRLYLGKVTFSLKPYTISEFPSNISQEQIVEFDTLTVGARVMQLNQLNFVEKE